MPNAELPILANNERCKRSGTSQTDRHYAGNVNLNGANELAYRCARTHLTGQRYVFGNVSNSAELGRVDAATSGNSRQQLTAACCARAIKQSCGCRH